MAGVLGGSLVSLHPNRPTNIGGHSVVNRIVMPHNMLKFKPTTAHIVYFILDHVSKTSPFSAASC